MLQIKRANDALEFAVDAEYAGRAADAGVGVTFFVVLSCIVAGSSGIRFGYDRSILGLEEKHRSRKFWARCPFPSPRAQPGGWGRMRGSPRVQLGGSERAAGAAGVASVQPDVGDPARPDGSGELGSWGSAGEGGARQLAIWPGQMVPASSAAGDLLAMVELGS